MWHTNGLSVIPEEADAGLIRGVMRQAKTRPRRVCLAHDNLGPQNTVVDGEWKTVDMPGCQSTG